MLTQSELKSFSSYDELTGKFTRTRKTSNNSKPVGCEIGRLHLYKSRKLAYKIFNYKGKQYQAHRAAWLYMTGDWPNKNIDHIDGDGTNNSWSNLREASNTENMRNCKLKANNKSGTPGVYWNKLQSVWHSQISNEGKHVHLGFYKDLEAAIASRKDAELIYGYHHNHGRR